MRVDDRHRLAIGRGGRVLVAGANRPDHLLDLGTHLAALRGVRCRLILGLAGALAGLGLNSPTFLSGMTWV